MTEQYISKKELNTTEYDAVMLLDQYNSRIILSECAGKKERAIARLRELGSEKSLGKIIYFANIEDKNLFQREGFVEEGIIEDYFKGDDAYCLSYFNDPQRQNSAEEGRENKIIEKALQEQPFGMEGKASEYTLRLAKPRDAGDIAKLIDRVFDTYPTPMNNEEYIKKVMDNEVRLVVAESKDGSIASVASAEMKKNLGNAEITDCATLEEHRGKGLMSHLIGYLEKQLTEEGFIVLYSLARALSPAVNIVLRRSGYKYTGRMVKNCNIMGKFEDMNIWVKKLQ